MCMASSAMVILRQSESNWRGCLTYNWPLARSNKLAAVLLIHVWCLHRVLQNVGVQMMEGSLEQMTCLRVVMILVRWAKVCHGLMLGQQR